MPEDAYHKIHKCGLCGKEFSDGAIIKNKQVCEDCVKDVKESGY